MNLLQCIFVVALLSLLTLSFAEHDPHHHDHDHEHHHHGHSHSHSHTTLHPALTRLTTTLTTKLTHILTPLKALPLETAALTASLLTSSMTLLSLPLLPLSPHLHHLLPFAAGALLADLTTHVLPQTLSSSHFPLLISVLSFAILDALLRRTRPDHAAAAINLAADALHNFCDGLSLGAAFLISPAAGVTATVAVMLHELPQEIADYALLLRAGFTRMSALLANFLCACTALLGTAVALKLGKGVGSEMVMPFAAGGLMYLTFSSIIPDVVADIAAPVQVDGKQAQVPMITFFKRVLFATLMAAAGVGIIALVEAAHDH